MKKLLLTTAVILATTATVASAQSNQENVLGDNNLTNEYQVGDTGNTYHEGESGKTIYEDGSFETTNSTTVESYKPQGYVSNSNLTTSGADTCFGSQTAGISGPGFGISGGSTIIDENCIMLKNSKMLTALGLKDAAVLLMMQQNKDVAMAIFGAYPELAETLTAVK